MSLVRERRPLALSRRTGAYLGTLLASVALLGYLNGAVRDGVRPQDTKAPAFKVMLLGFDGLDPEFLEYLLAQGKLPNFERLFREGAYAPCLTFKPTKSVVIWTSVATGKRMEKHGIIDWMLLSGDKRERVLASGNVRRTEALWNIASKGGKSVQLLNWWATWPAEPVLGEMVSNHYPKPGGDALEQVTYPPHLAKELMPLREVDREAVEGKMRSAGIPVHTPELAEATFRPSANFRREFRASVGHYGEDLLVERIAHHLLDSYGQRDLFAVIFRNIDIFSHFLWRFIDRRTAEQVFRGVVEGGAAVTPEVELKMNEAYARVLEPVYVHEDQRLGRLMERADASTVLIVVSDHGFQFRPYGFYHYGLDAGGGTIAPPGVIFLWGSPIRPGIRLREPTVFDVAPTVLYLMGLQVGRDMDGRVLTEAIESRVLAERWVQWIPTHDQGSRGGEPRPSPIDEEILEELETLGYIR